MSVTSITSGSVPIPLDDGGSREIPPFSPAIQSIVSAASVSAWNTTSANDGSSSKVTAAQVRTAIRQINSSLDQRGQNLFASVERDKETGIPVIKLLDKDTNETISQYPSKQVVAIAAALTEYQANKGMFLDINV